MEVHHSTNKPSGLSNNLLAPGFRFHPTDEELVRYYLRRKVCGKGFRVDAISDIDIYKAEPWDLPSMSRLKSRDMEWYFFSWLDKKYGNGSRTNRATEKGYWKTTGKDRAVYHRSQIVGMKKTLVYHEGRAPKGLRSNWVMHEYRLIDQELARAGIVQDAFVLCRIFQKSGPGPKNGERYGAPLVEEEWENDDLESILKDEGPEEVDFDVNDDIYLDGDDLEQILGSDVPPETAPPLSNFPHADGSYDEETTEPINDTQNFVVSKNEQNCELEQPDYKNYCDMPQNCELEQPDYKTYYDMLNQFDEEVRAVKHEYIGESSKSGNIEELDYLPAELFIDASDDLKYNNGGFLEANDLSNPVITDTSFDMLDDHFMYFDANTDNTEFLACDLEAMLGSEGDLASDHSLVPQNELNEKALEKTTLPGGQFTGNAKNDMALPSAKQELANCKSDFQYPYFKQASQMLGSISAPPAFASEFPTKNAILRLNSAAQSSMHVTAGMIQVRNMNMDRYGTNHSYGKQENVNIILSFGFARHDDGSTRLDSSVSIMPGKNGWVCFMLLCFLVLSISFKLGTYVCAY